MFPFLFLQILAESTKDFIPSLSPFLSKNITYQKLLTSLVALVTVNYKFQWVLGMQY